MWGAVADGSRLERRYRRRAGAAAVRSGGDGAITDRVAVLTPVLRGGRPPERAPSTSVRAI